MTDDAFRRRMMTDICRAGLSIEQALGSAQVCLCVCVCAHAGVRCKACGKEGLKKLFDG
jgi:hypothetical protein